MIRDSVVALLAQRLNNRTDLNDRIILEMQLAQEMRMEQGGRFQPWFMITEYSYEITDVDEPRIPVPEDFVMEVEEEPLWYQSVVDGKWVKLTKGSDEVFELKQLASGSPQYYSLVGDHFTFYPTPNDVFRIRFRYAAKQTPLDTNIENNWLKFATDLMVAEVGETIARMDMQNDKLADGFLRAKESAWTRLFVMHESRMHTNREYSQGDS